MNGIEATLELRRREADGTETSLGCAMATPQGDETVIVELGEEGQRLRLTGRSGAGERVLVDCDLSDRPLARASDGRGPALGFGVAGDGQLRLRSLRLARSG